MSHDNVTNNIKITLFNFNKSFEDDLICAFNSHVCSGVCENWNVHGSRLKILKRKVVIGNKGGRFWANYN